MMTLNWSTIKPKGMVGSSASACRSAFTMPKGLEFAAIRQVYVHTTGNDGAGRPTGLMGMISEAWQRFSRKPARA